MFRYLQSLHADSTFDESVDQIGDIKKSSYDKKEYRAIKLRNGLKALLISDLHQLEPGEVPLPQIDIDSEFDDSDDESDKSEGHYSDDDSSTEEDSDVELDDRADDDSPEEPEEYLPGVAMSVGTGSFADPENVQGLMHFLEHMVFMGSEKYPNEEFFSKFVCNHGGDDNGETEYELTTFQFDIQEQHVKRAMDIFSQFFVSPLLKKDAVRRERKAVQSEFMLAVNNDENRLEQLFSVMAKQSHPLTKFPWGNRKTLEHGQTKEGLRTFLEQYRKKYYVADNMTLAVQARESLDTLQEWVAQIFSKIPSSPDYKYTSFIEDRQAYEEFENPFDPKLFHKHYGILPVEEGNSLRVFWALPPQWKHYNSKPFEYITNLLGDEGEGSILSYLKKRMWALEIVSGLEEGFHLKSSTLFCVSIVLTDQGVQHLDKILLVVFQYLHMIKRNKPDLELAKELQKLSRLDTDHAEQIEPLENVVELSKLMHNLNPQDYVVGRTLIQEIDLESISEILSIMTPQNSCFISMSDSYKKLGLCDQEEKWFGTKYFAEEIPETWEEMFTNPEANDELALPKPNPYICNNFDLIPKSLDAPELYPIKEHADTRGELWFKPDYHFELPQIICVLSLIQPDIRDCPKQAVLLDLFRKTDAFVHQEELYPMTLARYEIALVPCEESLKIYMEGLSEKFLEVLKNKVNLLLRVAESTSAEDFEYMKTELMKSYHNALLKPKVFQKDLRLSILQDMYCPVFEKRFALEQISYEEFQVFAKNFFKKSYLKMLVQGNVEKTEAFKIFSTVHDLIGEGVKPEDYLGRARELIPGSYVLKVPNINTTDGNSCVINYYQDGPGSLINQTVNELLILIMQEKVFDQLRTKEQLGYEVFCSNRDTNGILGISISVSSQIEDHSVEQIDNKIGKFLRDFETFLNKMSPSEFENMLDTLKSVKNQKDTALSYEVSRNWDEIISSEYVFDRRKRQIDLIPTINRTMVLDTLRRITSPNCRDSFKKLSVQVEGFKELDWFPCQQATVTKASDLIRCIQPRQKSKNKNYILDFFEFKNKLTPYPLSLIKD